MTETKPSEQHAYPDLESLVRGIPIADAMSRIQDPRIDIGAFPGETYSEKVLAFLKSEQWLAQSLFKMRINLRWKLMQAVDPSDAPFSRHLLRGLSPLSPTFRVQNELMLKSKKFISADTSGNYRGIASHKRKDALVSADLRPTALIYGPNNTQVQQTVNFLLTRIGGACKIETPEGAELEKARALVRDIRELIELLEDVLMVRLDVDEAKTAAKVTSNMTIARVERIKGLDPDKDFLSKVLLYFDRFKRHSHQKDGWLSSLTDRYSASNRLFKLLFKRKPQLLEDPYDKKVIDCFNKRIAIMYERFSVLTPHQLAALDETEHAFLFDFLRFYQLHTYEKSMGAVNDKIVDDAFKLRKRIAQLNQRSLAEDKEWEKRHREARERQRQIDTRRFPGSSSFSVSSLL